MEYSNQQIPEGINTSPQSELRTFFKLIIAIAVLLIAALIIISIASEFLVKQISIQQEKAWIADSFEQLSQDEDGQSSTEDIELKSYLQSLANRIALAQGLPKDFEVTVHYQDDDVKNAFATIGGHIFLFKGLLKEIKDENTLIMLIGHEIAHVKNRDPIVSISRILGIQIFLSIILGDYQSLSGVLGEGSNFGLLNFSRNMESKADLDALNTLYSFKNNCSSATTLFNILKKEKDQALPEFLSSHPDTQKRIDLLNKVISKMQCSQIAATTALPAAYQQVWFKLNIDNQIIEE